MPSIEDLVDAGLEVGEPTPFLDETEDILSAAKEPGVVVV
jgi:hypothetical protein